MPLHKAFGVDLGSSLVKIYSQSQDTIYNGKKHDSSPQPGSGPGCGQ